MPEWMEEYRPYLDRFGGGNDIEWLMNLGEKANVFNNAPLALICCQMEGMVSLLKILKHEKKI